MMSTGAFAGDDHHSESHWGYEGKDGPEHWTKNERGTQFDDKPGSLEILNNGHAMQVNRTAGISSIT